MEKLLKLLTMASLFVVIFSAYTFIVLAVGLCKSTKRIEAKRLRAFARICICVSLSSVWILILADLRPYSLCLAYSECRNQAAKETVGVIDRIEQPRKDRICYYIDGQKYTMAYGTQETYVHLDWGIEEGDTVRIQYGERSKYIFDIREIHEAP